MPDPAPDQAGPQLRDAGQSAELSGHESGHHGHNEPKRSTRSIPERGKPIHEVGEDREEPGDLHGQGSTCDVAYSGPTTGSNR